MKGSSLNICIEIVSLEHSDVMASRFDLFLYELLISTMTLSLAEIELLISANTFLLVKNIILDIKNLYHGNGNRQVVLTFINSQEINS